MDKCNSPQQRCCAVQPRTIAYLFTVGSVRFALFDDGQDLRVAILYRHLADRDSKKKHLSGDHTNHE